MPGRSPGVLAGERAIVEPRPAGDIDQAAVDLLRVAGIGGLLRWHHARTALALPVLALSIAMVAHGFLGSQLAPKNLATTLTWVHYRGALVLVLLAAGNLFCLACPFMLPRELARRIRRPSLTWPRRLRNKWVAVVLFAAVLFAYELFDLWGSPAATAWLIIGYFAVALVIDALFKNASFCKHVCPIGQFNFAASTISPLEIRVRERDVCASCEGADCIRGRRDGEAYAAPGAHDGGRARPARLIQRGCELALFLPEKTGNMDCTFCLDCVHACPHDNVALAARLPASELWTDRQRSGIGRFSRRTDIAALALLFTFGALLNAFGMVSPVYAVQGWLSDVLGTTREAPVLGVLFFAVLVVEPVLLVGAAALLTRAAARSGEPLLPLATRFAYAFVPLGFGVWLAHYSFHFLTGIWTFVPVVQDALVRAGAPLLGAPRWDLGGMPQEMVYPIELGFLGLGLVGSLLVAYRIAERDYPARTRWAFAPWAVLSFILFAAALWLLSQPMEMRGTFLGS